MFMSRMDEHCTAKQLSFTLPDIVQFTVYWLHPAARTMAGVSDLRPTQFRVAAFELLFERSKL